jgi:hypothetical protein
LFPFLFARRDTALSLLEKSGFVIDGPEGELNSVHQDKRCPGLLHHHPALRANFAQSQMVKEGLIILQAKDFQYLCPQLNNN